VSEGADPSSVRYGDIWTIASTLGNLPPVPYLIVSSPAFHAAGLGVLACEVDMIEVRTSGITEPVPVLGTALLHTIGRYPAAWLREKVGEIEPARYGPVAARIRNLVGPG
jgi:hypothetical protein